MGAQENGKVIPFSPRIREDIAEAALGLWGAEQSGSFRCHDAAGSIASSR